jgi:hypothetical protein
MDRFKMTRNMLLAAAVLGLTTAGCVEDAMAPPPPPKDSELVHYWHFNALPEGTITAAVPADFSKLTGAAITYPGTGAGYVDRTDGSDRNLLMGAVPGFALRPRNPSNTRELLIVAPSTGYEKLVVTFAVMRTANGAPSEEFYYSANGGASWTMVGAKYDIDLDFSLKTFDLAAIAAVNNNPNLRFKILFVGDGAAGASGNNRFDNFSIEGVPL